MSIQIFLNLQTCVTLKPCLLEKKINNIFEFRARKIVLGSHTLLRVTNNKHYFVIHCNFFTVVKNFYVVMLYFLFVYKHLIYFRPLKDLDRVGCVVNSV
jgi:hypothetical protein